jgi:hypothetical protein
MRRHRAWATAFGVLASAALLAGCFDSTTNPVTPERSASVAAPAHGTGPFHRHDDITAWISRKVNLAGGKVLPQGTRYALAAPPGDDTPLPIPGGFAGGAFHTWVPGPVALGGQGEDVEPGTITNFSGFSGISYFVGSAVGSDGKTYDMSNDMRIQSGVYVTGDGTRHHGTFAFV